MGPIGVIIDPPPPPTKETESPKSFLGILALKCVTTIAEQTANEAQKTNKTNARTFSLTKSPPFTFDKNNCYASSNKKIRASVMRHTIVQLANDTLKKLPKVKML
jgi:hypothetical protein